MNNGQLFRDLLIYVSRNARAQNVIGSADHGAHRCNHVERSVGLLLKEEEKIIAIENDEFGIFERDRRRGTRQTVQHRELAEEIAFFGYRQNDFLAGNIADENLDLAAADDIQLIAAVTGLEQSRALLQLEPVNNLCKRLAIFLVVQREELDFRKYLVINHPIFLPQVLWKSSSREPPWLPAFGSCASARASHVEPHEASCDRAPRAACRAHS